MKSVVAKHQLCFRMPLVRFYIVIAQESIENLL